eukprot:754425-Hanusia_phi.AAC.2
MHVDLPAFPPCPSSFPLVPPSTLDEDMQHARSRCWLLVGLSRFRRGGGGGGGGGYFKANAVTWQKTRGRMEANLFLVMHLLKLREQVRERTAGGGADEVEQRSSWTLRTLEVCLRSSCGLPEIARLLQALCPAS